LQSLAREDQVLPIENLRLHHVGVAVADIAVACEYYRTNFGYSVESPSIHDPTQTAYVQFLLLAGDTTYLELVAPDGPDSKLTAAVKRGGGLNHLCYSVTDIEAAIAHLNQLNMFTLCAPVAAVAFPGRRIAWVLGRDRLPIELVEAGPPGQI